MAKQEDFKNLRHWAVLEDDDFVPYVAQIVEGPSDILGIVHVREAVTGNGETSIYSKDIFNSKEEAIAAYIAEQNEQISEIDHQILKAQERIENLKERRQERLDYLDAMKSATS